MKLSRRFSMSSEYVGFVHNKAVAVVVGSIVFTAGFLLRSALIPSTQPNTTTPSPRLTLLPQLSEDEVSRLPYPPDALPGGRDVDSPYGSTRVYEFGPEDGRKVLLIHGISTPCLALGGVAHALVEKGCRVMLFDLFGRGYSDSPYAIEHDSRLFITQILIVLASSPLNWKPQFDVVGYSLGGGISAVFTSHFPYLCRTLVLVAPSGLIQEKHISRTSRFLYGRNVLLEPILMRMVKRRLGKPLTKSTHANETVGASGAAAAEVNIEGNQSVTLSKSHPHITIESAVHHQVEHHRGFVPAFMSSIRHGPVLNQHRHWRKIGIEMTARNEAVLIILGERDPVIACEEIQADAHEVLEGHVKFVIMDAGHEAPVTKGNEVADHIWTFWQDAQT